MSFPLDLSVTGKPTPRYQKDSARRPLSANRARDRRSNIFGAEENAKAAVPDDNKKGSGLPPKANVITQPQHETIKTPASTRQASTTQPKETESWTTIPIQRPNSRKAPAGVPRLQLQGVIDADEKTSYTVVAGKGDQRTPSSRPGSRATQQSTGRRPPSGKKARGGGWQTSQGRKLAQSPGSSGRKKHEDVPTLDLQLSQSNEGLRELAKTAKIVREDLNIEYIGAANYKQALAKEGENKDSYCTAENANVCAREDEQISESTKIEAAAKGRLAEIPTTEGPEQLWQNKKSQFVEEALLVDQLGRFAMEEEEFLTSERAFQNGIPDPKARRHMDLFQTRPLSSGSISASLVKRLRFGARILTRNGHDALREINGFFFPMDNTLTMYEFRQFGTRSSALPFIQRGCYPRRLGSDQDEPYNLADIDVGKTLHFATRGHSSIPENLLKQPVISFRITDVDQATRSSLFYEGCINGKERAERDRLSATLTSEDERTIEKYLEQLQGLLREKLRNRASKTLTNIGRHCRQLERTTGHSLTLEDMRTTLQVYRVDLPDRDLDTVWDIARRRTYGFVNYVNVMQTLLGEMNEPRKALVRKAFIRLDPAKSGLVKISVLKKFFNVKKHPDVVGGRSTESAVMSDFLSHFEGREKDGEISYQEFEEYYEAVSMDYESNQEFALMMRNTWGV